MVVQFGQVVLGPPGSGKTTYCKAMASLLQSLGRKVSIINLDPANDVLPYEAAVDVSELIQVEEVMATKNIGPNGGLVFCMEMLEANLAWLLNKIQALKGHYLIFDLPGQAELYAHHTMVRNILRELDKAEIRLCAVYLVDSHYANDPGKYVSAVLLTLNSMLMMELPTVNILSKRYVSYKSGFGERVEKGSITFDECEEYVRKSGEPQPQSSRYEHYQNMFNYYVYPPRQ